MPRARDPNRDKAFRVYMDAGGKIDLVEIASQLNISAGTVRGWKSKDKWEEQLNGTFRTKDTERSKRSKGGQPGNKNAKGSKGGAGAAPLRNKNAEKHGAYSKVYEDSLNEDEIAIMDSVPSGEEFNLRQQIAMYTVRERRLLHQINEFKKNSRKTGLYVKGATKKKHSIYDDEWKPINEYEDTVTNTENVIKGIVALESELTKVQRAKTKSIDSLIRLRAINDRYDDLLNGWKAKAAAEYKTGDEEEMEEVQIYLPHNRRDEK